MKKVLIAFFLVLVLLCYACMCEHRVQFDFLHAESEISSIEFVQIGKLDNSTGEPIQTTIAVVEDICYYSSYGRALPW